MSAANVSNWLQAATFASVIIGLGLVVFELQQTKDLVRVQVAQETMSSLSQDIAAQYGDHAPQALARACFQPSQMTEEDMLVMHRIWENRMINAYRIKSHNRIAGFDNDWRTSTLNDMWRIAMFPAGKDWLLNFRSGDKELEDYVRAQAQTITTDSCETVMQVFTQYRAQ